MRLLLQTFLSFERKNPSGAKFAVSLPHLLHSSLSGITPDGVCLFFVVFGCKNEIYLKFARFLSTLRAAIKIQLSGIRSYLAVFFRFSLFFIKAIMTNNDPPSAYSIGVITTVPAAIAFISRKRGW